MPESDDTPPDVPPTILKMVKTARRMKGVSPVHLLLAAVVAMAAYIGVLHHHSDQKGESEHAIASKPSRSDVPKQRNGIDIASYCGWLGFEDGSFDSPPTRTPHCLFPVTPQNLVELCRDEHGDEISKFEFSDDRDAMTGKCIDAEGTKVGGIASLPEFCLARGAGWSQSVTAAPTPVGQKAAWRCRVDVDATTICAAQAGRQSVTATRTEDGWKCG